VHPIVCLHAQILFLLMYSYYCRAIDIKIMENDNNNNNNNNKNSNNVHIYVLVVLRCASLMNFPTETNSLA